MTGRIVKRILWIITHKKLDNLNEMGKFLATINYLILLKKKKKVSTDLSSIIKPPSTEKSKC